LVQVLNQTKFTVTEKLFQRLNSTTRKRAFWCGLGRDLFAQDRSCQRHHQVDARKYQQ
jgi:hypothetical protein